jgi:hypothetical protein
MKISHCPLGCRPWAPIAVLLIVLSSGKLFGIAGLEGTFEFGLDAPWRMEPNKKADGSIEYGAIPIQVTIHDGMYAKLDDVFYARDIVGGSIQNVTLRLPEKLVSLGKFYSVRVKELAPVERPPIEFGINSLYEIEQSVSDWSWPPDQSGGPFHEICRVWNGDVTADYSDLSRTSEWHATLWYVPFTKTPGASIALQIEVVLKRDPWTVVKLPFSKTEIFKDTSPYVFLRNYARVYLAPDPLPRFDKRWLYGDFHYHSQGTDNEGEAGYNYRGVIRAMGALGLDFLFAVDHASSSEQIIDADLPPVGLIPEIAHSQGDKLTEANARLTGATLRDMSAERFAFSHGLIYGDNGANRQASFHASSFRFPQNYLSYGVVPQIFLGGEVDAIPELKPSALNGSQLQYGNGLAYDLSQLCSPQGCDNPVQALLTLDADGQSFLVHDFQSLESFEYYGREHLLHFPNSSNLRIGNDTTFVASYTSRFGGATRRLDRSDVPGEPSREPLLSEFERKGVVFVAHHMNRSGSRGPDGVPWTQDHMLLKAFRSPAVLGLEFWNEDTRFRTRVCSHDFCRPSGGDLGVFLGQETGYERNEVLKAGSFNPIEESIIQFASLFGADLLPKEYHNLALPLEEVRRGFVSGGPAGSVFELQTFDVRSGLWQERTSDTEHLLHHGAYDWDLLNLRGLDFEHNPELTWLQPGEPRRMFLGGGSDAHGDLNYRRAGYFLGTDDSNDTAIGKPRNLVFVGEPEGPVIYHEDPAVAPGPSSFNGGAHPTGAPAGLLAVRPRDPIGKDPVTKPPIVDPPILIPIDPILIDPIPVTPPVLDPPVVTNPLPPIDAFPPIVAPPVIVDPLPPVNPLPPDALPPKDPVVDPGNPTPPVVNPLPPDALPPKDPVVDPGDPPLVVFPPDIRPPDFAPPNDLILDPGEVPPPGHVRPPDGFAFGLNVRPHTQEQVIRALRNGRFSVTDGPALRMAIDRNGNNQIDDDDIQMGAIYRFSKSLHDPIAGQGESQTVTLLTEIISTPEFGPIMDVDVYVGVHPGPPRPGASEPVEARMYAPLYHGPRGFADDAQHSAQRAYDSNGRTYVRQGDNYWNGEFLGDRITWNPVPGDPLRYTMTLVTTLHLDKYEVGKGITADRFFVRAFAATAGSELPQSANRYAFTNPIWLLRSELTLAPPEDPTPSTPPTGSDPTATPPTVRADRATDGRVELVFDGTLQQTPSLREPFQDVPGAMSPYPVPVDGASGFFRARK